MPERLLIPSGNKSHAGRIVLLQITYAPVVGVIMLYETIRGSVRWTSENSFTFSCTSSSYAIVSSGRRRRLILDSFALLSQIEKFFDKSSIAHP